MCSKKDNINLVQGLGNSFNINPLEVFLNENIASDNISTTIQFVNNGCGAKGQNVNSERYQSSEPFGNSVFHEKLEHNNQQATLFHNQNFNPVDISPLSQSSFWKNDSRANTLEECISELDISSFDITYEPNAPETNDVFYAQSELHIEPTSEDITVISSFPHNLDCAGILEF